jgi:sugar phosphate isomerase/epimerase
MLYLSTGCVAAPDHAHALEALARLGVTRAVAGPGRLPGDAWETEASRFGAGLWLHHAAFLTPDAPRWNLASSDEGFRKATLDQAAETMRAAAALGGAFYTVHPGYALALTVGPDGKPASDEVPRERALEQLCRSLDRLATLADDLGIGLLVENRPGPRGGLGLWMEPAEINRTLDRVAAPPLGLLLDVGHLLLSCRGRRWEPEPVLEELKGRVRAIEVSRNDGVHDSHTLPKVGGIELELAKLAGGLSVPVILESRDLDASQITWAIELLEHSLQPATQA